MDKLTPDSFGQVHMHRVERELEAYPLPVRVKMIEGVQGALDGLRYRLHDRLNPEEPDPELKTPEPVPDPTPDTGGNPASSSGESSEASSPGAEAASAPGEPGTVPPDSDAPRARETETIAPGDVGDIGSVLGTPPG